MSHRTYRIPSDEDHPDGIDMRVDIGSIPKSELDLILSVVRVVGPEEEHGQGVLVTCNSGTRTWQMAKSDLWITIRGDQHSFDGTYIIPGRIFVGAASFGDADNSCNISVVDNVAIAQAPSGPSMKLGMSTEVLEFKEFDAHAPVTAELSFREFQRVCSIMGDLPMNFTDYGRIFSQPPIGHVTVANNVLTMRRHWGHLGCLDTVVTIGAITSGTGSFTLNHTFLDALTNRLQLVGDPTVTISFDPDKGQYLHMSTDQISVHFDRHADGAALFFPLVEHYLGEHEIEYLVHDDGLIAAKYQDVVVRMQLFDGTEPTLRSTVTVLHHVKNSTKLLREINLLNTTRVGIRVWWDNGMVVVGADMRCDEIKMLTPILDSLVREARYLGGALGPMFGGIDPQVAA